MLGSILGLQGNLVTPFFEQITFAIALATIGCSLLYEKRFYWGVSVFVAAALIHPNIGVEFGAICSFAACTREGIFRENTRNLPNSISALCFFLTFVIVGFLIPQSYAPKLISGALTEIYGLFRVPHHNWYPTSPTQHWTRFWIVVSLQYTCLLLILKYGLLPKRDLLFIFVLVSGLLLAAGTLGAAIVHMKFDLGVTMHPFRLLSIFNWLSILCFAALLGTIADFFLKLRRNNLTCKGEVGWPSSKIFVCLLLFIPFLWLLKKDSSFYLVYKDANQNLFLTLVPGLILFLPLKSLYRIPLAAIAIAVLLYATQNPKWNPSSHYEHPIQYGFAEFARSKLSKNALILVPSDFTYFRANSLRSTIGDFKGVPFEPAGMDFWYSTFHNLWGPLKQKGFYAQSEGKRNLHKMTSESLREKMESLGVDCAILPMKFRAEWPALYMRGDHFLAQITDRCSAK